ncbi:hypothetical protein PHYSODRAFT_340042 [Phytophthora sojae]|uniref:RxLR effector protein n=1 Tax=Phytophthora sojae (strain P6497) TaxID=1094619 RepID=G5A8J5_PHYSP|nr:hypothetical protein PHYSODRAFT_340042 [Phytophthora sojae]EGZ08221.1 hypothetical protein PHYSODRAFT_340042 [Phytophthora sojae]|eukprot:XP_009536393.1 hypothetical protein PHYSODRAFT_340042 [Phytophthora sojae]
MQVYQLFLVAAASILISGQTLAATDSTQAVVSGATTNIEPAPVQTDAKRFMRALKTTAKEDDEERGLVADGLRFVAKKLKKMGWTSLGNKFLFQAWKREQLTTAQAANDIKLMTSPGLMGQRDLDLYGRYATMMANAKKVTQ